MESVVESVVDHPTVNNVKLNDVTEIPSIVEDVCHKSNGVAESANVVPDSSEGDSAQTHEENVEIGYPTELGDVQGIEEISQMVSTSEEEHAVAETLNMTEVVPAESTDISEDIIQELPESVTAELVDNVESESKNCHLNNVQIEEVVESEVIESTNDNVRFETEILVETNNDINEIELHDTKAENVSPNNILSELGQNIELSEVLRSSDVTEHVENNNCPIRQEVFNKEELLDILEGNDDQSDGNKSEMLRTPNVLEAQMALQQLSKLKSSRKKNRYSEPKKKITSDSEPKRKNTSDVEPKRKITSDAEPKRKITSDAEPKRKITSDAEPKRKITSVQKEESIVNALVKDWDDDEPAEEEPPEVKESSSNLQEPSENLEIKEENTVDSSTGDSQTPDLNKSMEDGQPQRRLGRVIKKKVIFDPDNPDTYTKTKTLKNKDVDNEKDQHQPKKPKIEQDAMRAKSKSPVSKMQWKKPPPKNSKQNKRLTEVDKLLMDEGAVNMIYQLTPEAPKGRKNMKTKAEFIKKLQSSTPDGKEMKFRERKKESLKSEEGEARKILGGKQRSSLGSSVKSPSVSEDFETHSADDSIIYRRHSSSSYSSSCMSPRRLSDVDNNQSGIHSSQVLKDQSDLSCSGIAAAADVFQPDSSVSNEVINKDDCLSIKKKLNSKLSLALNKRKRESAKTDKPIKKKIIKSEEIPEKDIDNFKYLSLTFDQRVAEICIRKSGSKFSFEVLKEMATALSYVDTRNDVSLTLIMSECGDLCSDLDLTSLLDNDIEKKNILAQHIAESVRSVLLSLERHSKLVCCGVWGACAGVGLGLVALSDVALCGERAVFSLHPRQGSAAGPSPLPVAALTASAGRLPQNVVNELVIFGHQLSASEALQSGLINRVLWPSGIVDQIQTIVKDIARQPVHGLLLKKRLMNLGKPADTFLSQLDSEAALMADYWTSDEGQEAIRASVDVV